MSCDGNRKVHADTAGGGGTPAAAAWGTNAPAVLDAVFEDGRSQFSSDPREQRMAEAKTRALFSQMRALGITPPTHSKSGLPRKDAQFGYAALHDTLSALKKGDALPARTVQLADRICNPSRIDPMHLAHRRPLSQRFDESVLRLRCRTCGRFSSETRAHICPAITDAPTMKRWLERRLKTPSSAYPTSELRDLMTETQDWNTMQMRHPVTGEYIEADLDSLIPMLNQGFVPDSWAGRTHLAVTSDGRVVPVFDSAGMEAVPASESVLIAAEVGSGTVPIPSIPRASAVAPVPAAAPAAAAMITSATPVTPTVSASGGKAYDVSHFTGSEYRKKGIAGAVAIINGETYIVKDRYNDKHYATARRYGIGGSWRQDVTISPGRTLPGAVDMLLDSETWWGMRSDGVVEVARDGNLLAIYDPSTRTAGGTDGASNMTSEQVAAFLAYQIITTEKEKLAARTIASDDGKVRHAMFSDLDAARDRTTSALTALDAAYLSIQADMMANGNLTFGGAVSVSRCPSCGKFKAATTVCCPEASASAPAPVEAPAAAPVSEPAASFITPDEAQALSDLGDQVFGSSGEPTSAPSRADALVDDLLRSPQGAGVTPEEAQRLRDALSNPLFAPFLRNEPGETFEGMVERLRRRQEESADEDAPPTLTPEEDQALRDALEAAAPVPAAPAAVGPVVLNLPPEFTSTMERMVDVLDGMTRRMDRMEKREARRGTAAGAAAPTEAGSPAVDDAEPAAERERPAPGPRPDRPVPGTPATEQEKLLSNLRMPRPDPTLSAVDPRLLSPNFTAMREDIPEVNPNIEYSDAMTKITRGMAATIRMGQKMGRINNNRSFGIYGPPGTGKNELAKQFAASAITVDEDGNERQGMPLAQFEFGEKMDIESLIGTTVLQDGSTRAKLGPLGMAAAQGSVICLNEVVRNPKALTELQPMLEEGVIRIRSEEAEDVVIPVHPSTVFVLTWNPGLEGDADRPAGAPLARIKTWELPAATQHEQAKRAMAAFATLEEGDPDKPHPDEVNAAVTLFHNINQGIADGQMQIMGRGSRVQLGPRELVAFLTTGKAVGWTDALDHLMIYGDQGGEDKDRDRNFLREQFNIVFGEDGDAVSRRVRGRTGGA